MSPTAVTEARARFPSLEFECADASAIPEEWIGAFDLVVEIYTLQVLVEPVRARVARAIASCVAPGGRLLVIARGRDESDDAGAMPWPLTRAELARLESDELELMEFRELMDDETPPVRRFVATFRRH